MEGFDKYYPLIALKKSSMLFTFFVLIDCDLQNLSIVSLFYLRQLIVSITLSLLRVENEEYSVLSPREA